MMGAPRFTMPAREGELEAVHRRELARLLTQGARALQRRASRLGAQAYEALLEPVGRRWRQRARRQVQLLERDGWQLEGRELLAELLAGRAQDLTAVEVISLAVETWPSPANFLALGQALLADGQAQGAQRVYAFLIQDLDRFELKQPQLRWRICEGLAAAWEALGKDRVAQGCLATSLDEPGSGAGPLVSALFLALELGREGQARRLASRLDSRFHGPSRRLDACIESLVARVELLRPGRWVPPPATASVFGELVGGTGHVARICRRLVAAPGGSA